MNLPLIQLTTDQDNLRTWLWKQLRMLHFESNSTPDMLDTAACEGGIIQLEEVWRLCLGEDCPDKAAILKRTYDPKAN